MTDHTATPERSRLPPRTRGGRGPPSPSRRTVRADGRMSSARPVAFAPGFADSSYRLFEFDEPVLQEVLKNDGRCGLVCQP